MDREALTAPCRGTDRGADRGNVVRSRAGHAKKSMQRRTDRIRHADRRPAAAVPVLAEAIVIGRVVADRPHVGRPEHRHTAQGHAGRGIRHQGPGPAVPMGRAAGADRPGVVGGPRADAVVAGDTRPRHEAPRQAVPVLDQAFTAEADGPDVVGGDAGHGVEPARPGGGHHAPLRAVPVLSQRARAVEPDGPGVVGGEGGGAVQLDGAGGQVRAGHDSPLGAVPVQQERGGRRVPDVADGPDVVGGSGGHGVQVILGARDVGAADRLPGDGTGGGGGRAAGAGIVGGERAHFIPAAGGPDTIGQRGHAIVSGARLRRD